jgi:hypothetical protein
MFADFFLVSLPTLGDPVGTSSSTTDDNALSLKSLELFCAPSSVEPHRAALDHLLELRNSPW